MTVFNRYAKFYDALYQEKNYAGEVSYLERLLKKYATRPVSTILDLGCGSGGHAILLSERGYQVTGVDRSGDMLASARVKSNPGNPEYIHSDLVDLALDKRYDAVVSMFAVLGYITDNARLRQAFHTIWKHLQPDGLLFFDAWFGPAVLRDQPSDRYKIVERGTDRIIRFAHPKMDVLSQTVIVEYKVLQISGDRIVEELDENHLMRYFFPREVEQFLTTCGFELLSMHPFLEEERQLTEHDWNMAVVARKRGE